MSSEFIPYGRQSISDDDIRAVIEVLQSDFITTGPKINEFEDAVREFCGVENAVAVSNGTAALHAITSSIGIGPGDEVIVTPMTFAASANCILYCGGTPVFADVNPDTLLIDPCQVEKKITSATRAIIAVDYAGQPCDYDRLREITDKHGLYLVADACHSIGGSSKGRMTGTLADATAFSFHPVKHITTGEGGMVVTNDAGIAGKIRIFRNHGITTDFRQREELGSWIYEMTSLGYNYRITDFQCALGINQLKKLSGWIKRRQEIAKIYDDAFADIPEIEPLKTGADVSNAYHLYVVKIFGRDRQKVFTELREKGIGVNVHYIPVHLHPYYREKLGTGEGLCPAAEEAYSKIISLPMFPSMSNGDLKKVIRILSGIVSG